MEDNIIVFLKDVQSDFCWLLYTREYIDTRIETDQDFIRTYKADFPYCCALASQIIASFLSAHGHEAKCFITDGLPFNHSWCECEGEIVDYTEFQFSITPETKEKFREGMTREKFDAFLKDIPVIANPSRHFATPTWIARHEIRLDTLNEAKVYPFNKEGLLEYADDIFETIQLNTDYV